ncbi:MAG TPA: Rieske 2Fe-2S domain-containing protein [Vampirovibrionales bacterium]
MNEYIEVADLKDLDDTEGKPIKIKNLALALFKLPSGEVYAIEDSCPHIGAPLHNGLIENGHVTCLWHSWCFNLDTGESSNCPGVKIKTYTTKIKDGKVFLKDSDLTI